jgi:hypothetical protein
MFDPEDLCSHPENCPSDDPQRPFRDCPFAKYLDNAMNAMGISPSALRDKIREQNGTHIDDRTIRAWRTGERFPKDLSVVRLLAEALGCPVNDLEECWITSSREKIAKGKPSRTSKKEKNNPLKDKTQQPLSIEPHKVSWPFEQVGTPSKSTRGKSALNRAIIKMIQGLGKPSDEDHNRILITFQSKDFVFETNYRKEWRDSLTEAIKNGWYIEHIIQIPRDKNRILITIANILRFISDKDQYSLYKFKHKSHSVAIGMVIIPGHSAMLCRSTEHPDYLDAGIYFNAENDDKEIDILTDNFKLLKEQADPVYQMFDSYDQEEMLNAFSQSDQEIGDRTVILRRLSEITRPSSFYEPNSSWARAIQRYYNFNEYELKQHLKTRERRHNEFRRMLTKSKYRYMYYESCLDEFVKTGSAYPYYFQATIEERLEQLRETRSFFDNNQNLAIAIISREEEEEIANIKPTFCEVKDGIIVIMEVPTGTRDEKGNRQHKWFLIKDPTITSAFQHHLSDIWDSLKDESKDPRYTLKWLDRQIEKLEMQLG